MAGSIVRKSVVVVSRVALPFLDVTGLSVLF